MKSIRTSRCLHGAPISLTALARLERRNFPVRLSDLLQVAHQPFRGHIDAGDVNCDWEMSLFSNGFWKLRASLHDEGDIAGDSYALEFLLDEARGIGAKFEGHLGSAIAGDNTHQHFRQGCDPWIRGNWGTVVQRGVTTHLRATPAAGDIVNFVILVLMPFGSILLVTGLERISASPGEDEPFDESQPCVQFHKNP